MVEQYGAEVIPVGTVEEGLRALEQKTPSVILSDLAMPEEDGFAFIAALAAVGVVEEEVGHRRTITRRRLVSSPREERR